MNAMPPDRTPPSYGAPLGSVPVCPRHPDRPSLIRCQRCERPVCTDCQQPASVGVQCVDCVHLGQMQQRATQPRTAVGAAPVTHAPIVTYTIMGVAILAFLLQQVDRTYAITQWLLFAPYSALALPWTFITSGFLHGGVFHLAFNMYALWAVGQYLERTLGHWRYAGLFLLSVIGGHVAVLTLASAMSDSWFTGTVGASGGIFGLFGALLVVQRRMGGEPAQVLVLIAINVVLSFMYPQISWQGHLGGLIVGTVLALLLFQFRPKAEPGADRAALARVSALWHGALYVVMLVVLVAVVWAKVTFMVGPEEILPFLGHIPTLG